LTEDDNAIWNDFVDKARRLFVRRISEDFFEKIELRHVLRPAYTDSFSGRAEQDLSSARVNTLTPTLAWELIVFGSDQDGEWPGQLDAAEAVFDLEIYEGDRPVYFADNIPATQHLVQQELEPCKRYRWSVRPAYLIDGKSRSGDWMMNKPGLGALGSPVPPDAPETFPSISTPCD